MGTAVRGLTHLLIVGLCALCTGRGATFAAEGPSQQQLCPHVLLIGDPQPSFSATEQRLICGDPRIKDAVGHSWHSIPNSQAKFHLRTFLEGRGRFLPRFRGNGERLLVDLGPQTFVSSLALEGQPASLEIDRRRFVIGELLTPILLTDLEQWVYRRLRADGYLCPVVKTLANPESGEVRVIVTPGRQVKLSQFPQSDLSGMMPEVLSRYYAFQLDEVLNADWLTLTERRIMSDGIVQSVHFRPVCGNGTVSLEQNVVLGKPRILSAGFGANTEGLLLARLTWRNTRIGPSASSVNLTGRGSTKEQRLNATFSWYRFPFPSRRYLQPGADFSHQNESAFELISLRGNLFEGTSWDSVNSGGFLKVGPVLELIRVIRGEGPRSSRFVSLAGEFRITSHYFEYYRTSPRAGFDFSFNSSFNSKHLFSETSVARFGFSLDGLWNYGQFDPPLFVAGFRLGGATLLTSERPGPGTRLPPNYLQFLGGSADLRGYGRRELPLNGVGAMTSLFGGVELRNVSSLPYSLQPFIFFDAGLLGEEPTHLNLPVFASPGAGLRWETAVGVFRGTFSHGTTIGATTGVDTHWQFYFSFGEEF